MDGVVEVSISALKKMARKEKKASKSPPKIEDTYLSIRAKKIDPKMFTGSGAADLRPERTRLTQPQKMKKSINRSNLVWMSALSFWY